MEKTIKTCGKRTDEAGGRETMDSGHGAAMGYREHRRLFSRMGWALLSLLALPVAVEIIPIFLLTLLRSPLMEQSWFGMALSAAAVYLVGYPVAWAILRTLPAPKPPQKSALTPQQFFRALFVALSALYLTNLITVLLTDAIGALRDAPVSNPVEALGSYPLAYSLIVSCVLAPLAEEGMFRGLLLGRLRPYGEPFALVISALTFAMMHGNLSQLLYAFTVGLVLGYVALRTGRLRECVLLHALVNFVGGSLGPLLELLPQQYGIRDLALGVMSLGVVCAIVLGVVFFLRCRRSLWLERGSVELSEGRKWGLFFANPGMAVYTLAVVAAVCAFLFLV